MQQGVQGEEFGYTQESGHCIRMLLVDFEINMILCSLPIDMQSPSATFTLIIFPRMGVLED